MLKEDIFKKEFLDLVRDKVKREKCKLSKSNR